MKSSVLKISVGVLVVAILLVLSGTFYSLEEGQQAIIVQFGRPVGDLVTEAGLNVKLPFSRRSAASRSAS